MNYEPASVSSSYQLDPTSTPTSTSNNPFFADQFVDQRGRTCRVVCDQSSGSGMPKSELRRISQMMIGLSLHQARRIYPNVREVQRNGQQLPTTNDFNPNRINVATWNGRINRIEGFY